MWVVNSAAQIYHHASSLCCSTLEKFKQNAVKLVIEQRYSCQEGNFSKSSGKTAAVGDGGVFLEVRIFVSHSRLTAAIYAICNEGL